MYMILRCSVLLLIFKCSLLLKGYSWSRKSWISGFLEKNKHIKEKKKLSLTPTEITLF